MAIERNIDAITPTFIMNPKMPKSIAIIIPNVRVGENINRIVGIR